MRPQQLVLQPLPGSGRFVLVEDWTVDAVVVVEPYKIVSKRIVVPTGFQTDGASIPRILWPFFGHPFETNLLRAAILHDFLYSAARPSDVTRKQADIALRELAVADGLPVKAFLIWWGVRLFGWWKWKPVSR